MQLIIRMLRISNIRIIRMHSYISISNYINIKASYKPGSVLLSHLLGLGGIAIYLALLLLVGSSEPLFIHLRTTCFGGQVLT
jgi:hypothetical protein